MTDDDFTQSDAALEQTPATTIADRQTSARAVKLKKLSIWDVATLTWSVPIMESSVPGVFKALGVTPADPLHMTPIVEMPRDAQHRTHYSKSNVHTYIEQKKNIMHLIWDTPDGKKLVTRLIELGKEMKIDTAWDTPDSEPLDGVRRNLLRNRIDKLMHDEPNLPREVEVDLCKRDISHVR